MNLYKLTKKLTNKDFKANIMYTNFFEKTKIKENTILFQSYDGSSISGNVYYMLQEIYNDNYYDKFKKYVVASSKQYIKIKKFLKSKKITNKVKIVILNSRKYSKLLAQVKYLINNATFPTYFIKKEGQVYINTWHGTPLKAMGRSIKNSPNELGNTQRNFFMADYLLFQNDFMFEKMREDYMLNNFYKGEYLISGYPRNDIFYNKEAKEKIKKELNIQEKKVYIYMPTWRGSLVEKNNIIQYYYLMYLLFQLDTSLKDDTILYVKLHNYVDSKINFKIFNHIRKFPDKYETSEFLNITDGLITDYSSVFFDYANTKRKIILFAYDKNSYLANRGLYLDYDKLPFTFASSVEELIKQMEDSKNYTQYQEFVDKFCKYDSINTTRNICNYIFKNIKTDKIKVIKGETYKKNKENVLIFGGALAKNGITTALKGIFKNIDLTKRNYILTFYKSKVEANKQEINSFKEIDYIPLQGRRNTTIFEKIIQRLYFKFNVNTRYTQKIIDKIFKREQKRLFPNIKFDYVIHFSGYERNIMHLFKNIGAKKIIFVHNDLNQEEKTKSNFHKNSLIEAYKKFDKIAVVRETMVENIQGYLEDKSKEKICVVHNFNNIDTILKNKDKEIVFDHETYANIELSDLKQVLEDNKSNKFINIARFSKEKGLDRLIKAFQKFQSKSKNNYLIIIGGYGVEFEEILKLVEQLNNNHIIIIKSIRNPYPILDRCDCFILSSLYEGLPMTIMEALILGKKVISTNIQGPREFLSKGYGYLVENSENGLIQGFEDYTNGKLKKLKKFDAEQFNNNALKEFEKLFE